MTSSYWSVARLQPRREGIALHFLQLHGYTIYLPRLCEHRHSHGRRIERRPPLFPGYVFLQIQLQWHSARWSPGVTALIMDGPQPARVPDNVIQEIRSRERNGLIELPKPRGLQRGESVRITGGPFENLSGLYAGQAPQERVLVLLSMLGASRRVALPAGDVVATR